MANEIQIATPFSSVTLWAIARSALGTVVKVSDGSLVAYVTANLANYVITMTQQGTASGYYTGTMPPAAAGIYFLTVYQQAAGSPAEGDRVNIVGSGWVEWDGAAVVPLSSRVKPADTLAAVTNLANAPTAGDFTAAMKTSLNAATPASVQNIAAQTGDSYARLGAPAGATIAADLVELDTLVDAIPTTPLLAANVPANFAALLISVGGHISNVDTLATYTGNTVQTGDSYARLGAAGAGLTALASSTVAPSWYTGPDNTEIAALVASIGSGLHTELDAVKVVTDHLATALELNAGNYRFTVAALANAPGISGNVTVGGYAAGQDPAALVLDAAAAGHNTAGTIGAKINAAGASADPLLNATGGHAVGTGYAALDKINASGVPSVTWVQPVTQGQLLLYAGDDYPAGRIPPWALPAGTYGDLTGAVVSFNVRFETGWKTYTGGSITAGGTAGQALALALTAAQTSGLPPGAELAARLVATTGVRQTEIDLTLIVK
jgi:hypothetical protein